MLGPIPCRHGGVIWPLTCTFLDPTRPKMPAFGADVDLARVDMTEPPAPGGGRGSGCCCQSRLPELLTSASRQATRNIASSTSQTVITGSTPIECVVVGMPEGTGIRGSRIQRRILPVWLTDTSSQGGD